MRVFPVTVSAVRFRLEPSVYHRQGAATRALSVTPLLSAVALASLAAAPAWAQSQPVVQILRSDTPSSVVEGTSIGFLVSHNRRNHAPLTVNFSITDGAGDVLRGTVPMTVTIPPQDVYFPHVVVTVETDDDSDHETASTVTAALQSSSDYVFGRYWTTSVSVTDNDPLLSVRAVGAPPAGQTHPVATEGATFEFVVSRTMTNPNANLRPLTVDWEVVEQPAGGYLPAGVSGVSQQATFAPGETELTVEVPTVDDAVHEGGSAFAPLGHVTFRLLTACGKSRGSSRL